MILDDIKKIKKLDSQNMLGSLQLLSSQAEEILAIAKDFSLPKDYKKINNVLVLGMGGSALGIDLIKNLFANEIKLPLETSRDYHIPAYVNSKTLVIASSYSGNTEETVSVLSEAKKKKAKIIVICTGGELAKFAEKNKIPSLLFSTNNNPCGSPRMGLGYSIIGQLILFAKAGLLKLSNAQIREMVKTLAYYDGLFGVLTPLKENIAKQISSKTIDKSVWYVASEHLSGNVHIAANQMNENAKRFGGYFLLPELNHHLLEGMINPKTNKNNLLFVLFQSDNYFVRNQKRYTITKDVLQKNKIAFVSYQTKEKNKILEACEVLVLGSYVSYYSSLLKNIDPTAIPFVDYFKKEMGK